jgi:hypothetical protein
MQAGWEEVILAIVVEEQFFFACHLILSTAVIPLGYRSIVTCMELNINILLAVLQMMMLLVLYATYPHVRFN